MNLFSMVTPPQVFCYSNAKLMIKLLTSFLERALGPNQRDCADLTALAEGEFSLCGSVNSREGTETVDAFHSFSETGYERTW